MAPRNRSSVQPQTHTEARRRRRLAGEVEQPSGTQRPALMGKWICRLESRERSTLYALRMTINRGVGGNKREQGPFRTW